MVFYCRAILEYFVFISPYCSSYSYSVQTSFIFLFIYLNFVAVSSSDDNFKALLKHLDNFNLSCDIQLPMISLFFCYSIVTGLASVIASLHFIIAFSSFVITKIIVNIFSFAFLIVLFQFMCFFIIFVVWVCRFSHFFTI